MFLLPTSTGISISTYTPSDMSRLTRFLLIGCCGAAVTAALLAGVLSRLGGTMLFASVNFGMAVAALDAIRNVNGPLTTAGRLKTGGLVGGVVALITASGLVAPYLMAELQPEVRLHVQLLVLSVGYAAATLAWLAAALDRDVTHDEVG